MQLLTKPRYPQQQQGAVLIISIMLLIILTIVSLSSVTTSILQEKTASNSFNTQLAFQASETSLRTAENYIRELTTRPVAVASCNGDCNKIWEANAIGNLYGAGIYQNYWWSHANSTTNDAWWNTVGHTLPATNTPDGGQSTPNLDYVAAQPRFVVEEIAFIPDDLNPNTRASGVGLNFYRITSRGIGGESANGGVSPAQITLQSIFGKRYN